MKEFFHKVYQAGASAYFDTFSGMVPCKVLEVITPGEGRSATAGDIRFQITGERGAYKKGEILRAPASKVVPKDRLYTRGMFYRINTQYAWEVRDKNEQSTTQ